MAHSSGPTPPRAQAAPAAARAICAHAPASLSPAAAAFARAAAARAAPRTRERAKALLYAAGRLAAFGESVGMELQADTLLREATIERFALTGCPRVSAATRRTLRSNLRALARAHEARPSPQPAPLPRERAKAPYGEAEIDGYLRLAAAQPTEARRMRATALLCLGAGAGLIGAELRHLRGHDVKRALGRTRGEVSGRQGAGGAGGGPLPHALSRRPPALPGGGSCSAGGSPAVATSAPRWGRRCARTPDWRALSRGGCGRPGFASARSRSACGRSWTRPGCAAPSGSATWWPSCRRWMRPKRWRCSEGSGEERGAA